MKQCSNCGESNLAHAKFCKKCGNSLHDAVQSGAGGNIGNANLIKVIAIAFVFVVLVVGVVIWLAGREDSDKDNYDDSYDEYEEEDDYNYEEEDEYDYDSDTNSTASSEYIFPESNRKYLTKSDLYSLNAQTCRIARNEIYARHGRMFNDSELQAYFNSKSWYSGTVEADKFSEAVLNAYEKANAELILQYENEQGYR